MQRHPIDDASDEVLNCLDHIYNDAMELAVDLVRRNAGFAPFGLTMSAAGQVSIEMIAGDDLEADELAERLWDGFREQAGSLVAVAVTEEVVVPSLDSAAINVAFEHRDGLAVESTTPFRRRWFPRGVVLGDGVLAPGVPRVW